MEQLPGDDRAGDAAPYQDFVQAGMDAPGVWNDLKGQFISVAMSVSRVCSLVLRRNSREPKFPAYNYARLQSH